MMYALDSSLEAMYWQITPISSSLSKYNLLFHVVALLYKIVYFCKDMLVFLNKFYHILSHIAKESIKYEGCTRKLGILIFSIFELDYSFQINIVRYLS